MRDPLDTRIRELTYRLVQMAPEAPPFPEVPLTTLTPLKTPTEPPRRRSLAAWTVAAAFVVGLLIAVPILLVRGDQDAPGPGTTPTVAPSAPPTSAAPTSVPPTTAPTQPVAFDVTLYFLADYVVDANLPGPHLVPVRREMSAPLPAEGLARLDAQLRSSILALIVGPAPEDSALPAPLGSAIPAGTELLGLSISETPDRMAVVLDFNRAFESGGSTFGASARLAQVVYTATQFDGVDAVEFTIEGAPVEVFSSEGIVLDGPQRREDHRAVLPQIFAEVPLPGDEVSSPVEIRGEANTFEATVEYRIETVDGAVLADGFTTATCGSGCWGQFSMVAEYSLAEAGSGFVVLFETSAEDGRPVNVVRIPVELAAAPPPSVGALELFADVPGSPLLSDGLIVVDAPLRLFGSTENASVTVAGTPATVTDGSFEATVPLVTGSNEITVTTGATSVVYEVVYLPDGEVQFGFVARAGGESMTVDDAEWFVGDEAVDAAVADGAIAPGEGLENGYYIRNTADDLRDVSLAPAIHIVLQTGATGPVSPVAVSLEEWLALFKDDGTPWNPDIEQVPSAGEPHFGYLGAGIVRAPYWLTLDGQGVIVQVLQQYVP